MYRDNQWEQMERYARKLELVQAVRAENAANRQRIQHRNHIFYKTEGEPTTTLFYDKEIEDPCNTTLVNFSSSFVMRVCISILCIFLFLGIKKGWIQDIAGINDKEIKTYITQDFSKVVVDYMKNFTYTLNYEKTSIK